MEVLLDLEGGVGLGAIVGEAIDGEPGGSQRLVGVAEEACLLSAWFVFVSW